jgi:hypothetical protein
MRQEHGNVYFNMWSMDVKVEGENVVRNFDMTTHNHGSLPGNAPPWPYIDKIAVPGIENKCRKDKAREQKACGCDKKKSSTRRPRLNAAGIRSVRKPASSC